MIRIILCIPVLAVLLAGCLSVRPPAETAYISGAAVDSLTGNSSLSYSSPDRSISGSGVLMYRRPDHLGAVILSPFGSVLQEVYVSNDLVTIIDAGNGIAFSGSRSELPNTGDFSGWRYVRWIMDFEPYDTAKNNSVTERINRFGHPERVTYENGLLVSKTTAEGGSVRYSRYTAVRGIALPLEIVYETAGKEKFTIILEDPEINVSFADRAFTPDLAKYRVYPLSGLR